MSLAMPPKALKAPNGLLVSAPSAEICALSPVTDLTACFP
jgi:hypothetical protein